MKKERFLYLIPIFASIFVIIIAILVVYYALIFFNKPFLGFFVARDGSVSTIIREEWNISKKGISPFDRLISVNGIEIRNGFDLQKIIWKLKIGDKVKVELDKKGIRKEVTLKLGELSFPDFFITFIIPYLIGILYLIIGLVVFFARRNYPSALFLSASIPLAIFYITTFDYVTTYKFSRLWVIYPIFAAVSIHFFIVFPFKKEKLHTPFVLGLNYLLALIVIILREINIDTYHVNKVLITSSAIYMAVALGVDIALLIYSWIKGTLPWFRSKAQFSLFSLFLTATTALVWVLAGEYRLPFFNFERALVLSAIFPLFMGYAIIKANIFDISYALKLSISYIVTSAFVFVLYFIFVALTSLFIQTYISFIPRTHTVAIVSTLIVATLFNPIRSRIQKMVDILFFKDKERAKEILFEITEKLASYSESPERFYESMARSIKEAIRVERLAIYIKQVNSSKLYPVCVIPDNIRLSPLDDIDFNIFKDKELIFIDEIPKEERNWLRDGLEWVKLILPVVVRGEILGLIFFGEKRKGKYRIGDLELLETIKNSVTPTIQYIVLLQEVSAKEKLASLGQFSSMMIHEIKNPLGIIKVSLGGLRKRLKDEPRGVKLLNLIEEETERMNLTISKVLNFVKPQLPQPKSVEVEGVIRNAIKNLEPILNRKSISLSLISTDYPNRITADPEQLYHIFFNIILNAAEAVEAQKGWIECDIYSDSDRREVIIEIKDNGPGIPKEIKDKIFTPFFTTKKAGNGLGLAIVEQFVKLNKGTITVEDNKPRGAKFRLIFPMG